MASRQTVSQTLADVMARRPALKTVLRAFEPLLSAQAELAGQLADDAHVAAFALAVQDEGRQTERARQGIALLAGIGFSGLGEAVRLCAERLLPLLNELEAMKPRQDALRAFFLQPSKTAELCEGVAEALVSGDEGGLGNLAQGRGLEPAVLHFVAGFVVAPVLRAVTSRLLDDDGQGPWDKQGMWKEGFCPVCGALPVIGWLDRSRLDEKNAFLVGGGGKKHLHCGLCGAAWQFRRNACPACGKEGNDVVEFLRESEAAHGERLDWCTGCRSYCPTVDLREREGDPHMDALALGMMHLDMVAARRKLRPLRRSFWNAF